MRLTKENTKEEIYHRADKGLNGRGVAKKGNEKEDKDECAIA